MKNELEEYSSEQLEKEQKEFEKKHPILNKIQEIYYWCYRNLNPIDYYREVKWFLQRGFRGYSDRDLWDIDYFFRETILKGLKAFKKIDRSGFPMSPEGNKNYKQLEEEWEKTLEDMIDGLDYITTDLVETEIWKKFEKKLISYNEYHKEANRIYNEKEQKAMLFIKNIKSLWD